MQICFPSLCFYLHQLLLLLLMMMMMMMMMMMFYSPGEVEVV